MENGQSKLFSMICPNCGKMIFAGKQSCESCGWKRELATPKKENIEQGRFSTKSNKLIRLSVMIGIAIVMVMGLMMNFFYSKEQRENVPISKDNAAVEIKKSEKPVAPMPEPTSAELLKKAKEYFVMDSTYWAGIECLKNIKVGSKEYPEAQRLLKRIRVIEENRLKKDQVDTRKSYDGTLESAGSLLIGLIHQKVLYCDENATDMFIYVEPLWWKKQPHIRKTALVKAGMVLSRGTKEGVIVQDMTTKAILAIGFLNRGEIKIYK